MQDIQHIVQQIPAWRQARELHYERIAGLTNANYRVVVDGEAYVLRVNGQNTQRLGIDREHEYAALQAAEQAGIGPKVIAFLRPEGHLVTRWVEGRHWDASEYRTPENVRLLTQTVQQIHRLPLRGKAFSIFQQLAENLATVRNLNTPLTDDLAPLFETMRAVQSDQSADRSDWQRFCHNDLASMNYLLLETERRIIVLDWEFAGNGDLYYDLASASYTHDDDGPLPPELEDVMLASYFGATSAFHRRRLLGTKFMLIFFNYLWGLTQGAMVRDGLMPGVAWFDYWEFSRQLLAHDLHRLQTQYWTDQASLS